MAELLGHDRLGQYLCSIACSIVLFSFGFRSQKQFPKGKKKEGRILQQFSLSLSLSPCLVSLSFLPFSYPNSHQPFGPATKYPGRILGRLTNHRAARIGFQALLQAFDDGDPSHYC